MSLKRKLNILTALVGTVAGLTACSLFIAYDLWVQNQQDEIQWREFLERDLVVVCLVLLVTVLLAQLVSRRFSAYIARPFEALVDGLSKVSARDDYSIRLSEAGDDELAQLASSFNQMMNVIESRDQDLRHAHELFDGFVNHSPSLATIKDTEYRYVFVNFAARRLLGLGRKEIIGKSDAELWPPEVAEKLMQQDREAFSGVVNLQQGDSQIFGGHFSTLEYPSPDGPRLVTQVRFMLRDARGRAYLGCSAVDETERLRAERAMRISEERYALAVRGASDGIWDWDLSTGEIYFSERCNEILGRVPEPSLESLYAGLYQPDLSGFRRSLERLVAGEDTLLEVEFRLGARADRWVLCRAIALRKEAEGRAYRVAGFLTDITQRKQQEEQLRRDAFHDALTGLPNRALFHDRLTKALERLKRYPNALFAVLFLDLDGFKSINDTLGHAAGDQLLIEVANRLRKVTRAEDTVARMGGDEFTLLVEELTQPADVIRVAERVHAALRKPIEVGQQSLTTAASIGITVSNRGYGTGDEMLADSDTAMYLAKRSGKGTYRIFDTDMHEAAMVRMALEQELRQGVEQGAFCVQYQPIFALDTSRVVAVEALLRWNHPTRGLLYPVDFLQAAEDCGLLNQLTPKLCQEALRDLKTFLQVAPDLQVAINLSVRQFQHPAFCGNLQGWLKDADVSASRVRLEITERALARDPEGARQTLERLRGLGVSLTLDDFGSGSSSLENLRSFPFTIVKIDEQLVSQFRPGDPTSWLVQGIVHYSRGLQLDCIAEGIETEEQLNYLRDVGCPLGQGRFWSGAVAVQETFELLRINPGCAEESCDRPVRA